jgi:hypothetical protein
MTKTETKTETETTTETRTRVETPDPARSATVTDQTTNQPSDTTPDAMSNTTPGAMSNAAPGPESGQVSDPELGRASDLTGDRAAEDTPERTTGLTTDGEAAWRPDRVPDRVPDQNRRRDDLSRTDQEVLARLRGEFAGQWHIWPGGRDAGRPPRLWCATRTDPAAGVDPTVIEESPARLVSALLAQAAAVKRGDDTPIL